MPIGEQHSGQREEAEKAQQKQAKSAGQNSYSKIVEAGLTAANGDIIFTSVRSSVRQLAAPRHRRRVEQSILSDEA